MFTSKDVMTLRQQTGAGMMDCKKALIETDGDMEKAVDYLREKGVATAAKKASRIASEGIVYAEIKNGNGVMIEVNCESDFVARGDAFKDFVKEVADYIAENDVASLEDVVAAKGAALTAAIAKIGEKIDIRRYVKISAKDSAVDSYIHMGGKIGVLVEASAGASADVIHDVALQIAAARPSYIRTDEVSKAEVDKEMEILKAQALNEENPKPLPIIEKMVQGRIKKYYKEVCLLEQDFVKDSSITVSKYLKDNGDVKILKFVRYEMGEGLEKKADTFVDEIMESVSKVQK